MGLKRQIQLQEVIKNDKKNAETTGASLMDELGFRFARHSLIHSTKITVMINRRIEFTDSIYAVHEIICNSDFITTLP